jgi:hypothetical protein
MSLRIQFSKYKKQQQPGKVVHHAQAFSGIDINCQKYNY